MWLDFVTYMHHHGHEDKLPWYRGKVLTCFNLNSKERRKTACKVAKEPAFEADSFMNMTKSSRLLFNGTRDFIWIVLIWFGCSILLRISYEN